jgi:hypothetical protein
MTMIRIRPLAAALFLGALLGAGPMAAAAQVPGSAKDPGTIRTTARVLPAGAAWAAAERVAALVVSTQSESRSEEGGVVIVDRGTRTAQEGRPRARRIDVLHLAN